MDMTESLTNKMNFDCMCKRCVKMQWGKVKTILFVKLRIKYIKNRSVFVLLSALETIIVFSWLVCCMTSSTELCRGKKKSEYIFHIYFMKYI